MLPTYLIIGAAKAGTTALHAFLGQHPDIFVCSPKEPRFFAFEDDPPAFDQPPFHEYIQRPTFTRLADYEALFAEAGSATARGEASTVYSYYPGDKPAERIRHYLPDVKLIMLLRQPAERAYANFVHGVRNHWEPLDDFVQALDDEPRRIQGNWSYFFRYRQNSDYATHLKRFYDRFDRRQIRIYLYEDFRARPLPIIQDIFRFLGVDDAFTPDLSRRYNVSRLPRSRRLHRLINRSPLNEALHRLPRPAYRLVVGGVNRLNLYRPKLAPELRRQLTEEFKPGILRLQDMIERDLSAWL